MRIGSVDVTEKTLASPSDMYWVNFSVKLPLPYHQHNKSKLEVRMLRAVIMEY